MRKNDFLELRPMLLEEIKKPFDSAEYLYEIKFDGFRALIFIDTTNLIILSRNGLILNSIFPELEKIKEIIKGPCILDGEIISLSDGKPDFKALQERFHLKNKAKIKLYAQSNPVVFMAFDLLDNSKDLTNEDLIVRKKILDQYPENEVFKIAKYYIGEGKKLFRAIKKMALEGIVTKKLTSKYYYGKRVNEWLKIKNFQSDYFFIGGYTLNKNETMSLYLGEEKNQQLFFVGKITVSYKQDIYAQILKSKPIKKSPFINYGDTKCLYLNPKKAIFVYYTEKTKNNRLRHPKL